MEAESRDKVSPYAISAQTSYTDRNFSHQFKDCNSVPCMGVLVKQEGCRQASHTGTDNCNRYWSFEVHESGTSTEVSVSTSLMSVLELFKSGIEARG